MTEEKILNMLDNSNDGYYCSFVELGQGYSYLIDSRLNVFRGEKDHWAIAVERLSFNPRVGSIILDIYYFGNCLTNLDYYNNRPTNYYSIYLIDNFDDTIDGESLKIDASFWLVRGQKVPLSHKKQDYLETGIELKEFEPNEISAEEAGRLAVSKNRELFRATDGELYKSIPAETKKILVLDEWYHKDFLQQSQPAMTDKHLEQTFKFNKNLTDLDGINFEEFAKSIKQQESLTENRNREIWEISRPSSYETWQQIAKTIATNDLTNYKPTLKSNTHWINWPDSGTL